MRQRPPMSAYRERETGGPPAAAGEKPGIDFEAEDEKENDHHRWRARQSRDDPGAKACEATCIFCVGMLFLQVAYIVYTYGVQGTLALLMSPDGAGLPPSKLVVTYQAIGTLPPGYDSTLVLVHDQPAGMQRLHFTENGTQVFSSWNVRVVVHNTVTHSTSLLFYGPDLEGFENNKLESCFILRNDTSLRYGLMHPYDTYNTHSAFKVVSESLELTLPPKFDEGQCVPFTRTSNADLSWTLSNWTTDAPVAPDPTASDVSAQLHYGKWCGPHRGGFTNCCNGMRCVACDEKLGLTQECLRQCAPADAMDTACAKHKECNLRQGDPQNPIPGCYPGFRCQCDAEYRRAVEANDCHTEDCKKWRTFIIGQFDGRHACWGADYSCLHVPCPTAPTGFCNQCGYYKTCHQAGAPKFAD